MSSLMGVLKLLGQSQFEGLTLFRDVNQERVDTVLVSYGRTLKLSGRRRLYGVYIRYVKRHRTCLY